MQSPERKTSGFSEERAVSSVYCKAIVALANANVCVNPKKQQTAGATRARGMRHSISYICLGFFFKGRERKREFVMPREFSTINLVTIRTDFWLGCLKERKKETYHPTNSFILLLEVCGCHCHQVWQMSFDHCVEGSVKPLIM